MSVHKRDQGKRSQQPVSSLSSNNNGVYTILRDGKSDELRIVPRNEIISAKKSGKIDIGDVVSHGVRDKRIRGTILLLGSLDQCQQSVRVIEQTRSSTQINVNTINTVRDDIIEHQEQDDADESDSDDSIQSDTEENSSRPKEGESLNRKEKNNTITSVSDSFSPSSISTSLAQNESPRMSTESTITVKRKTSPNESEAPGSFIIKRSKHIGYVSLREHSKIIAQLSAANDENMIFQTTWMPRPSDKATIQYLVHIGKVLSNETNADGSDVSQEIDKGDLLERICSALCMTETELSSCKGKTLLSTARQIVAARYPDENATFTDVTKDHIQAIADYAGLMHPNERKINDLSKIRKALGNVFACRKFSRRFKSGVTPLQNANINIDGA